MGAEILSLVTARLRLFASAGRHLFIGLMVASLIACGGGGGSSAPVGAGPSNPVPTPTPVPQPDPTPGGEPGWANATDVFSAAPGSLWLFTGSDTRGRTTPVSYRSTVQVEAVASVQGRTLSRFKYERLLNESTPYIEWRFADDDGISSIGASGSSAPGTVDGAMRELRSPIRKNDRYTTLDASAAATDYDGDGIKDVERLLVVTAVAAVEAVSVPAGTVAEAARVESTATASVTLSRTGQVVSASAMQIEWHARGIGVVKRQFFDPNYPAPNNVVTEELIGMETPALSAGVGREFRLFPAPDLEKDWWVAAVASDGTDLLIVTTRTVPPASWPNQVVARLYSPAGDLKWHRVVMETADAEIAFDSPSVGYGNGQFHVLFERRRIDDSVHQLVRQRLTPAGEPLDPAAGVLIDEVGRVELAPAKPRFNADRVMYAWRREGISNGFILDSMAMSLGPDLVPMTAPVLVAKSAFVPRVAPILGRPGEFALFVEEKNFRLDRAGSSIAENTRIVATSQRPGAIASFGENVAYSLIGGDMTSTDHLLYGALLYSDPKAAVLSTRPAQLLATAPQLPLLQSITWNAMESTPSATILAYSEANSSNWARVRSLWIPHGSGELPQQPAAPMILSEKDEYQVDSLQLAAADNHAFVVRRSRPDPVFGQLETRAIVVRPPFAR